jgi:D-arginine dehydrogenase
MVAPARLEHLWCGMRTLTGDGRFAVGPDPDVEGLFWVAGLGGHGMCVGAEVGHMAARLLAGGAPDELARACDPARLVPGVASQAI